MTNSAILILAAIVWPSGVRPVFAQRAEIKFTSIPIRIHSGVYDLAPAERPAAFRHLIESEGAAWLRVRMADSHLGKASYLTLTSVLDGDSQRFNSGTLAEWQNTSGIFNGGAVILELHVAPGDQGVFVEVGEIIIGDLATGGLPESPLEGSVASLCGIDDRVPTSDPRVGRLWFNFQGNPNPPLSGGCTAWLAANGAVLTAGHCVDSDPDAILNVNCGNAVPSACCTAALPDGAAEPRFVNAIIEFNVPASLVNGVPVAAALNDQYPVDSIFLAFDYPGCNQFSSSDLLREGGRGSDWAVFSVGRNPNTLLTPHAAQDAFHRVAALACTDDCNTCITGFGIDNTPTGTGDSRCQGGSNPDAVCLNNFGGCISSGQCPSGACCQSPGGGCNGTCNSLNVTQQQACGPYVDFHSDGARRWHEYSTDTTGANSGSPITITAGSYEYAIGIHTQAGCPDTGNYGTSFAHAALALSLNDFPGVGTVYADAGWGPCIGKCDGTIFEPFSNIAEAVQAVGDGRIVAVIRGSYPAAEGNTFTAGADGRAMTLIAPVGPATIGN